MGADKIRNILVKMLLGTLIVSAAVAVIAILVGEMNDIVWRAIGTVVSAMFHIGVVFAIVSIAAGDATRRESRSTAFVINSAMAIASLSFFTSIFGIWGILDGEISLKLYATYAVALFALVHAKTLADIGAINQGLKPYVLANYALIVLVVLLILGAVYAPGAWDILDGFYGRLLAASVIVDVTLSISIAVLHRIYLQKHPELQPAQANTTGSGGRIIVAILLFVFVVWPLLSLLRSFAL